MQLKLIPENTNTKSMLISILQELKKYGYQSYLKMNYTTDELISKKELRGLLYTLNKIYKNQPRYTKIENDEIEYIICKMFNLPTKLLF